MLRILYYSNSRDWGGAEIYLARFLIGLRGGGIERHLAVPRGDAFEQFSRDLRSHDVTLHPYEANPAEKWDLVPSFLETREIIRKVRPDLVHFMLTSFRSCRYSLWTVRWYWRLPVVLTIHLLNPADLPKKRLGGKAVFHYLTLRAMQGSKAIIAVSEGVKNQLIKTFSLTSGDNIRVIYNGVDERSFTWDPVMRLTERSRWGLSASDFVVVMVARLSDQQKAQSAALEAFVKLPTSPQRSVLVFVGEGPSRAMLEAKTDQLGLRDRVIFTGRLPDVQNLLTMADVAILPSRYEGFPIALLEAMACRLPVVASCVTGVPEMVEDNVSGLIIDPANVEQLASKLLLLYQDEDLRNRLGKAAQMTIKEKFSLRRMIEETLKIYH